MSLSDEPWGDITVHHVISGFIRAERHAPIYVEAVIACNLPGRR